jgi:protein-tyrosine phosphatase
VHCGAGISRSATIVIGFLMKYHNCSYNIAYNYVKNKRYIINPNPGFIDALKELESTLFNY